MGLAIERVGLKRFQKCDVDLLGKTTQNIALAGNFAGRSARLMPASAAISESVTSRQGLRSARRKAASRNAVIRL